MCWLIEIYYGCGHFGRGVETICPNGHAFEIRNGCWLSTVQALTSTDELCRSCKYRVSVNLPGITMTHRRLDGMVEPLTTASLGKRSMESKTTAPTTTQTNSGPGFTQVPEPSVQETGSMSPQMPQCLCQSGQAKGHETIDIIPTPSTRWPHLPRPPDIPTFDKSECPTNPSQMEKVSDRPIFPGHASLFRSDAQREREGALEERKGFVLLQKH